MDLKRIHFEIKWRNEHIGTMKLVYFLGGRELYTMLKVLGSKIILLFNCIVLDEARLNVYLNNLTLFKLTNNICKGFAIAKPACGTIIEIYAIRECINLSNCIQIVIISSIYGWITKNIQSWNKALCTIRIC